jgi:hypothetical protein
MMVLRETGGTMRSDRSKNRKSDTSAGVSEVIGAMLLVSIVGVSIAVIGIYLFSQPVPQKIPNLNFMTGVNSDKTILYLYHNGGDTLTAGEFSVVLDGVPKSYSIVGGGSQWSLGKNLIVPITTMPQNVQLIYNNTASSGGPGSTGPVLLSESSVNIVSTGNVSADQLPYLDCAAVSNWDCADQIPLDIILSRIVATSQVQRINFVMNDVNNGITGSLSSKMLYHFNVTVSKANSSIVFGNGINSCNTPRIIPLGPNDKVSISFPTNSGPEYFILYGIAPSIWEMSGGSGGDIMVTAYNSTTHLTSTNTGNALCHTWITEYNNIESTMQINGVAVSGAPYTNLIVNTTTVINGPYSLPVVLDGFKPTQNGMFLVSFPGNSLAPLYTIGWANQIKINGVVQTGLGL